MSYRGPGRAIAALIALLLAAPRPALAQAVDPEKRAAAQALFDAGRQLSVQGQYAQGCPKLVESYALDPAIGTKFYLADCFEHIGKLASAWTYYLDVVEEAHSTGAADREKFANERATALKPRLPQLTVTLGRGRIAGLVVRRDGIVIGEGTLDTPIPVDLGEHTIKVTAPGKKPWETRVVAKQEGEALKVAIPPLELDPAAAPKPEVEPPPPPPPPTTQRSAGFVVGGVGIASLLAGFGAGAAALSKKNASNAPGGGCSSDDVCTTMGQTLRQDAIQAATASTALIVVGAVGVGVGGLLVLTAPSATPKGAGSTSAPQLSLGLGTFALRMSF